MGNLAWCNVEAPRRDYRGADAAADSQAASILAYGHWCRRNQNPADQGCGRERRNWLRTHVRRGGIGAGSSGILDGHQPFTHAAVSVQYFRILHESTPCCAESQRWVRKPTTVESHGSSCEIDSQPGTPLTSPLDQSKNAMQQYISQSLTPVRHYQISTAQPC